MSAPTVALVKDTRSPSYDLGSIVLKGAVNTAELREALNDWPKVSRGITAASTLTLSLDDHHRTLADSPMFADQSFADYGDLRYDLVGVSKAGDSLQLTFEDALTCALRRQTADLVIPAGTQTRGAILSRLFTEAGVRFLIDPASSIVNKAVERKDGANSWDLSGSLAQDIGWRRFSDGTQIVCGSDDWLASLNPNVELREFTDYVHTIDWELDTGQPANRATVDIDVDGWVLGPGHPATIVGQGMANGVWLVEGMDRTEGITRQQLTLVRRQLVIPEPPPESSAVDSDSGEAGNLPTGEGGTILTPPAGRYGNTNLDAEQVGFAVRIARVAANRNLGNRGAVLGIMCALQESSLRNLAGGDRDSVGLFQQRPSQGWGTVAQCRNPEYAAGQFYDRLVKQPSWASATPTKVIQAVQRSGHPDAYAKWKDEAEALVQAMVSTANNPGTVNTSGGSGKLAAIAIDLASKGLPYVFGGKGPNSYDCSGFVAECTKRNGKSLGGGSKAQHARCEREGKLISVQQGLATSGAILFRMTGDPTHVAISLGNGSTAEARGKAYGVKVFPGAGNRQWTHAAIWP